MRYSGAVFAFKKSHARNPSNLSAVCVKAYRHENFEAPFLENFEDGTHRLFRYACFEFRLSMKAQLTLDRWYDFLFRPSFSLLPWAASSLEAVPGSTTPAVPLLPCFFSVSMQFVPPVFFVKASTSAWATSNMSGGHFLNASLFILFLCDLRTIFLQRLHENPEYSSLDPNLLDFKLPCLKVL